MPPGDAKRYQMSFRIAFALLVVGVAAVLLLGSSYATYASPGGDEFCFAALAESPWEIANRFYFSWSGRWLGMLLFAAVVNSIDILGPGYRLLLLSSFVLWFGGFFAVARLAMPGRQIGWHLAGAAVMLAVFWTSAPGQGETFYWLAGIVIYALPFALSALCALLLLRNRSMLRSITGIACGVAACLINELAAIILIVGALAFVRTRRGLALVALACFSIAFLIVILSPGNATRAATIQSSDPAFILWTLVRPYKSILSMLGDPRIIAMTTGIVMLPRSSPRPDGRWWLVPAIALAAVSIAYAAVTLATQMAPADRVIAFLYAVFISALFWTAWHYRGLVPNPVPIAILSLLLVTAPVVGSIFEGLKETRATWLSENQSRWRMLMSAQGTDAVVPEITYYPPLMDQPLLVEDAAHWTNQCVADYFNLKSVAVR